jgi:hypothetical protein
MSLVTCSKCFYSLSIVKDTDNKTNQTNKKIILLNTSELFLEYLKKIRKEGIDDDIEIKLKFSETDFQTYLKSQKKLSQDDIQVLLTKYKQFVNKKISNDYIKKCIACQSKYPLEPNTIVFSLNLKQTTTFNDDNIDLKLEDKILPRTKDYICENTECLTNNTKDTGGAFGKNILLEKEAIIYRSNHSHHIKYACNVCKYKWNI